MEGIFPGSIIDGRYEVVTELGEGGMGVVFRAQHMKMDRTVAIKFLKPALLPDKEKVDRFMREAQLVSRLKHDNIVNVYSIGLTNSGQPYIAMEYVEGVPLTELIAKRGFLKVEEALPIFTQVCDALAHAHHKKVVHRDVKPSNIMIVQEKPGVTIAKVVDFGIAKSVAETHPAITQTGLLMGSAFYMSPGQCAGRLTDVRSDVYSLGCTLFEALTGKPPFRGETFFETLSKQLSEEPPAVNDINPEARISGELQSVLDCMLQKDPINRYQSMDQLKADLTRVLAGQAAAGIPALQKSTANYLKTPKRKHVVAIGVAIAVAAIVCIVPVVFNLMKPEPVQQVPLDVANLHYSLGVVADLRGDFETAEKEFKVALPAAKDANDPVLSAAIYHRYGYMLYKQASESGQLNSPRVKQGLAYLDQSTALLEPLVLPYINDEAHIKSALYRKLLVRLLINYSDCFQIENKLQNFGNALRYSEKFMDLYIKAPNIFDDRMKHNWLHALNFAVDHAINSGDEQRALNYIRVFAANTPRASMDKAAVEDTARRYCDKLKAKFGKSAEDACAKLFARKS